MALLPAAHQVRPSPTCSLVALGSVTWNPHLHFPKHKLVLATHRTHSGMGRGLEQGRPKDPRRGVVWVQECEVPVLDPMDVAVLGSRVCSCQVQTRLLWWPPKSTGYKERDMQEVMCDVGQSLGSAVLARGQLGSSTDPAPP